MGLCFPTEAQLVHGKAQLLDGYKTNHPRWVSYVQVKLLHTIGLSQMLSAFWKDNPSATPMLNWMHQEQSSRSRRGQIHSSLHRSIIHLSSLKMSKRQKYINSHRTTPLDRLWEGDMTQEYQIFTTRICSAFRLKGTTFSLVPPVRSFLPCLFGLFPHCQIFARGFQISLFSNSYLFLFTATKT